MTGQSAPADLKKEGVHHWHIALKLIGRHFKIVQIPKFQSSSEMFLPNWRQISFVAKI
jgi:hypothetical protein